MIFKESEPDYAAQCLRHAEELYSFGENHRAKYSDSSPQVANFYNSWSGYNDELAWGAAWVSTFSYLKSSFHSFSYSALLMMPPTLPKQPTITRIMLVKCFRGMTRRLVLKC